MTYESFIMLNNAFKNCAKHTLGLSVFYIESVDGNNLTYSYHSYVSVTKDGKIRVTKPIVEIIESIKRGQGFCFSNPSKLRNWKGWTK